jgi:hypothetical protein
LDFGFWILDFGFWILDFGFWIVTTQPKARAETAVLRKPERYFLNFEF